MEVGSFIVYIETQTILIKEPVRQTFVQQNKLKMKKILFTLILALIGFSSSFGQVGIGTTTPAPSSILDLTATNKALLVTRVADVEDIINPVNGMVIYDTTLQCFRYFQKGVWSECGAVVTPEVLTLECGSITVDGTLTAGTSANGVTVTLPYTGGNSGNYTGQIVSSTGVIGLTATLLSGTLASGNGTVLYTITGTPSAAGTASFSANLGGQTCTFDVAVASGGPVVSTLNCAGATLTGTLTANTNASGVFVSIGYTGGNGNVYNPQVIQSTGVTGLTAFLNSGTLTNGAGGTLVFSLSGTPVSGGVASFALTFGGMSCSFSVNVTGQPVVVALTNCAVASTGGNFTQGQAASGTQTVAYSGGNGLSYNAISVASSGISGLTATLPAGTLANGTGNFVFTITGTPTSSGTATFNLSLFGATCSFTRTVNAPTANAVLNCGTATFSPTTITRNVAYNGTITVPYTGGNSQSYSAGAPISSTGVTGLTATLQAGTLTASTGNLSYTVTGTPTNSGTANFALSFGVSSCTLSKTVNGATITGLTCGSATFNPTAMTSNTAYSGTMTVPYTGGNGAPYPAGAGIGSTGVAGLTATLQAGTLAVGNGNLTYTVSGTPTSTGNAVFALSFGGQSCSVTKAVSGFPTSYTPTITLLGAGGHIQPSSFPVFFDTRTTYTAQDAVFGDMRDLRLHQDNKDIIQLVLNPAVIPGGKLVISWSRIEKPNGLGLIVDLKNGGATSQASINSLTNTLPNATLTASGNDMTLTINIIATMNTIVIKSSQDNDGKDPILTEIRMFDNNNVQIPIN